MWQNKPTDRTPSESAHDVARRIAADVERAHRLNERDVAAWQAFVLDYSPLLYGVIRRVLFAEDDDAVRTVYVDVLHDLYNGKIGEFRGQSPLSAWLVVLARGSAVDYLRKRDGRDQLPAAFEELSAAEREAFKLRYVEGMDIANVVVVLRELGYDIEREVLIESFDRIETVIGARYLRSLEYRLKAIKTGVGSARLLRYMVSSQSNGNGDSPLEDLIYREDAQAAQNHVRSMLAQLSRTERLVLRLRFQRGWRADRVAKTMRLESVTQVYQITRRATHKLQKSVLGRKDDR